MKASLIIGFSFLLLQNHVDLTNSVWAEKIAKTKNNLLTFKPKGLVLEYDCELNYTFHSSYKLSGDTVIISGRDDSHSEDGGKVSLYWISTYLMKDDGLYLIKNKVSDRGKWKIHIIKNRQSPDYKKL